VFCSCAGGDDKAKRRQEVEDFSGDRVVGAAENGGNGGRSVVVKEVLK